MAFREEDHPRGQTNNAGQFAKKNQEKIESAVKTYSDDPVHDLENIAIPRKYKQSTRKPQTPAEKIASVHIDFDKDNILPELNEEDLQKVGAKVNKSVLLKKSVIDRNRKEHADIADSDFEQITAQALYSPSEVFAANKDKPYFHFAKVLEINSKGKPEIGIVLLDVDDKKDNFEIVHANLVRQRSYEALKKKV